jgi:glycosyltransferase involved in cell wall biosynthesis
LIAVTKDKQPGMIDSIQKRRRPRVLLLAFACSPARGSEPYVGWHRALECAKYCDTCVICEEREFADEIGAWLERNGQVPGLEFIFVRMTDTERKLYKIRHLFWVAYNLWQRRVLKIAEALHAERRFDLVHQATYCGFREPGYLWQLDAPFVWGPFGGTQNYPLRFLSEASWRGAVSEGFRSLANRLQLWTSRRVRAAARRARVVLTSNSTNLRDIARISGVVPRQLLETGLRESQLHPPKPIRARGPLRILWVGDLQTWKALPLLLKALAQLCGVNYELRIAGRGRDAERLKRLARTLGIDRHVRWLGQLPPAQVAQEFAWADVFVFTSLRDTSGNVVLEAFAAGVPVICLDHQGAHDMVTGECGIKVPVTTPRRVAQDIAAAIMLLADDPDRLARLGQGAKDRAEYYLWPRQGARMAQVYREVLGDDFVWSDRSAVPTALDSDRLPEPVIARMYGDSAR